MSIELKIKSKHLSVEAKIIRHEENKLRNQILWKKENAQDATAERIQRHSLNEHRRVDVRDENRATYLARAFIAETPYILVEQKRKEEKEYHFYTKILPRVLAMVKKYSNSNLDNKHIKAWVETHGATAS